MSTIPLVDETPEAEQPAGVGEAARRPEAADPLAGDFEDDFDLDPTLSGGIVLKMGVAAFLSTSGAGWLCASLFSGAFARVVALLGSLIGAGLASLSYRTRRPGLVQTMVIPVTLMVGAILLIPYTSAGHSLPSLVSDAVRVGGLEFAPVPFSPGWHFILLLLTALTSAASVALAAGLGRPRMATFLALPLLLAVAFILPRHGGLVSAGIGLVLVVASLAVSYGLELARDDATSTQFEMRRLAKAAGTIGLLGIVLVVVAQAGFLFPPVKPGNVIPPRQPQLPPPVPDKVLFTASTPTPLPFRVGVLDGYADNGWETAPYDPSQLRRVPSDGTISADAGYPVAPDARVLGSAGLVNVNFTVRNLTGNVVPDVAEPESINPSGKRLLFYPRTQILQVSAQAGVGTTYSMIAAPPPSTAQMEAASQPPASLADFTRAPTAPPAVQALLARAPASAYDRVQFLRTALYKAVVAKGAGTPARVPPQMVAAMLAGHTASPYQIVGAEALLARWAGVPARIGYGYYSTNSDHGTYQIRPSDGSSWLEIYLGGIGWVPLVGQPLHAEASLGQTKPSLAIQPSNQLALVVYVPIRLIDQEQLYVVVRYWIGALAPYVAAVLLALYLWPGFLKLARRAARRRWASRSGPLGQIVVAYAELRDAATDLRIGTPQMTPLQFLDQVAPDDEHAELAWLMTRSLWGDLRRDVQPDDANAAATMTRSVGRRIRGAQPPLNRVSSFAARESLRRPFSLDIPALWPEKRARSRRARGLPGRKRLLSVLPGVASALLVLIGVSGCSGGSPRTGSPAGLPVDVVPASITFGSTTLDFQRETAAEQAFRAAGAASLVTEGRIYTVRLSKFVEASLQVGAFKAGIHAAVPSVQRSILASFGSGRFAETTLKGSGHQWTVHQSALPSQTLFVYFPPSGSYYDLLVAQQTFPQAQSVLAAVLDYQEYNDAQS
jgi:transglutaminase-like putative cysteine protease